MKAINFEFTNYTFEPEKGRATFNYKTEFEDKDPILWTETILFPEPLGIIDLQNVPKDQLEKILQSLHIILGISYYKFYCPPAVTLVKAGATLSQSETEFWNTIYKKGLGEFLYRNKLDPAVVAKFDYTTEFKETPSLIRANKSSDNKGYLVGVSGGKDSIVGTEIMKKSDKKITTFYIEAGKKSDLVENVIKLTELPSLKIRRILDQKVFEKHQYNGHIPISAIYAFLGIFTAILYGYRGFIVSNEYSSNFGNIKYKGLEINHQWSKTFEFEKLFNQYLQDYIGQNIKYFSLLRPFYEIRIAKMFVRHKKYFNHFSSCNANFRLNKEKSEHLWCGKCAKCVFVFTLLSAFMTKNELQDIFQKNLYQDKTLLPLFKDILGFGKLKPFDCVGTFEESQTALKIASKQYSNDFIVRQLAKKCKLHPEALTMQQESLIPEDLKFLELKNVLIAGYGKEGQATEKYLNKFFPDLKIKVAEGIDEKNYIKKEQGYDFAIKTPGINKRLMAIPHTTATNIFFSRVQDNNTIVGVTGSKGKSTTSTLIYQILKDAGKDVEFLGNIGKPMLEYLINENPKNKIFVLELSSYQLDDIRFSPQISVVTNLFPEHLNYHGNLKNYFEAKKNIINFQNKNNYFVYNQNNTESKEWLKDYKGQAVGFDKSELKSNLLGEHNKANIASAIEVAKILGVPEESFTKTIANFKSLEHRLEFIGEFKKIKFYDDAISTTPESTIEALKALAPISQIGTIFLGGEDRGYNFTKLAKEIKKCKITNVVLFPESGKKIKKTLGNNYNFFETKDMQEAVKFAYKNTQKGSVCLLSCASPSYSVWKNFEEKGDLFKKFVIKFSK